MAKYNQYETVLLKDGRIGAIVEVYGPSAYEVDVGHSPKDWESIFASDADIERKATREECERHYDESMRQLKDQGIV